MKRGLVYSLIVIVFTTIGFTSCNDDDDDNRDADKNIFIGKWEDGSDYLEFKKGSDITFIYENQTLNGTYKITDFAYTDDWRGEGITVTWFIMDIVLGKEAMEWLVVYDYENEALLIYLMENGVKEKVNSFYFHRVK
jgi:hypothetical protein